ncbi:MAG TPA: methyltransferase [Actinomycetota bacterium]|nr:methyltransferase [Actinomycetota bacterium]
MPSQPFEVDLVLPGGKVRLVSDRGVFSTGRVDPGTSALLKAAPAPPGTGNLLDLGCGWGPIAVTLASAAPATVVWALDVNRRALALVADNAARLALANIRPVTEADIPAGVRFAEIWSNPPIRVGKDALHDLLGTWLPRLVPGGRAWLVVQRHLGADSLATWLSAGGWTVRRAASKSGYRILEVRPAAGPGPVPAAGPGSFPNPKPAPGPTPVPGPGAGPVPNPGAGPVPNPGARPVPGPGIAAP